MPKLAAGARTHWALRRLCPEDGWSGVKNGELLALAVKNGFDVFLTGDRNLAFQQNVSQISIAVVVLETSSTQLHHTLPLMPKVLALPPSLRRGQVFWVSA